MKKIFISVALLALPFFGAMAQSIVATNEIIDCGQVLYQTPATFDFEVKNKSNKPVRITDVCTSCGCTDVAFPREAIAAGEKFTISITYDAATMGHFDKLVGIYNEGDDKPLLLRVRGSVVREVVDYGGNYNFMLGSIKSDCNDVEFDDVNRGDRPVFALQVYNGSKMSYRPQLMHLPRYLSAVAEPEVIRPGSVGRLYVTLDSEKLQNMGLTQTSIYLSRFEGDRVNKENEINVSTTLLPDFTDLPPQTELAPSLAIDSTTIVLTASDKRRKASGQILLRNTGRSPLVVKALQVYNPGISVSLGKRTLKPGAVEKLKISVSEMSDKFKGRRRILLITNDPEHAKVVIDVIVKK